MKKCLALVCFMMLVCSSAFAIMPGTYELRGSNDETGTMHYQGEVIVRQNGNNYELLWKIGRSQSQIGVGILDGNVLSVAYLDKNSRIFGVISYVVSPSGLELDGRWATIGDNRFGREYLIWKNSFTY